MKKSKLSKLVKKAVDVAKKAVESGKSYILSNHLALINLAVSAAIIKKLNLIDEHLLKTYIDVLQAAGFNAMLVLQLAAKLLGGDPA